MYHIQASFKFKDWYILLENRRGTKRELPFGRDKIVRIDRIFYYFGNLLRLEINKERMNGPVLDTDGRQDMKQLYLG